MRNILLVVGAAGLISTFAACGGGDKPNAISDDNPAKAGSRTTGGKGSGGSTNAGGADNAGAGGDNGVQASNAPVVKITSPTESATPDDGVLVGQLVHVLCTVVQSSALGATEIDPTSVTITVTDATGKTSDPKTASATKNDNEYSADFVLATVPSGDISLTCAANDTNKLKGSDTISTFVDHGPTITIVSPLKDSAHPLKGGLDVEFQVEPTPLAKNDPGADVDTVVFTLDGKPIDSVKEVSAGNYKTNLALDDLATFPVTPSGAITITATNKRTPAPVTATLSYDVVIDGNGPVITIDSPAPQQVVGGKVTLTFDVTDKGSGVDENSVNVALYHDDAQRYYDPNNGWGHTGDRYTFTFDTKAIEPFAKVQTTINILASDKVGNASASGQSLQLYLDNVPPQIDLDPRNIRIQTGPNCSNSFDPVGFNALNDLEGSFGTPTLFEIGFFRVFVNEQTNSQAGQQLFYFSGTDQTNVRLYVQADPSHATTKLLVNKNPGEDNTCDDIGGIDALNNGPPFSALKPISSNGAVGTLWNQVDPKVEPLVAADTCVLSDAPKPQVLCPAHTSDMWYSTYFTQIKEPMVYVVGTPNNDASCAGIDLAFLTQNQPEGWVCAAARVVDNAGNVGISPPIRICADDGVDPKPDCAISSTTPPSCTDGCTPPARGGGLILPP